MINHSWFLLVNIPYHYLLSTTIFTTFTNTMIMVKHYEMFLEYLIFNIMIMVSLFTTFNILTWFTYPTISSILPLSTINHYYSQHLYNHCCWLLFVNITYDHGLTSMITYLRTAAQDAAYAGVSSFGFGGTNAHAEAHPEGGVGRAEAHTQLKQHHFQVFVWKF